MAQQKVIKTCIAQPASRKLFIGPKSCIKILIHSNINREITVHLLPISTSSFFIDRYT